MSTAQIIATPQIDTSAVYLLHVLRHNLNYDGHICTVPVAHDCGNQERFRVDLCARGIDACFDLSLFGPEYLLRRRRKLDITGLLDTIQPDNLLFFWTYRLPAQRREPYVVGLYVVSHVEDDLIRQGNLRKIYGRRDLSVHFDFPITNIVMWESRFGQTNTSMHGINQLQSNKIRTCMQWLIDQHEQRLRVTRLQEQERESTSEALRRLQMIRSMLIDTSSLDAGLDPNGEPAEVEAQHLSFGGSAPSILEQKLGALAQSINSPAVVPPTPLSLSLRPTGDGVLERLLNGARDRQLVYPRTLLQYLHISLQVKPFVVLTGRSGGGKTALTRLYAEVVDAVYNLVKVQPDWVSNTHLIGYFDVLRGDGGQFVPTDFTRFLRHAVEEYHLAKLEHRPARRYLVCLDEMNLARVEHYLSEILSAMELPEDSPKRTIHLYDAAEEDPHFPRDLYLPPNFMLMGTLNVDETSYTLSPKVLDRVRLLAVDFFDMSALKDVLASEYDPAILDFVFGHLIALHRMLADDPQSQFGYRVARDIMAWVNVAILEDHGMSQIEALDCQIVQKIFTRLRIDPESESQQHVFNQLKEYFTEGPGSELSECTARLNRLEETLTRYHYADGQQ